MPRQMILRVTCNLCGDDVPEDEVGITDWRGQRVYVDLCKRHQDDLGAAMAQVDALLKDAQPVKVQLKLEGVSPCPVCDKQIKGTLADIRRHITRAHRDVDLDTVAPLPRKKAAGIQPDTDGRFPCPECDFFSISPQGLGAHRQKKHGVLGAKHNRSNQ